MDFASDSDIMGKDDREEEVEGVKMKIEKKEVKRWIQRQKVASQKAKEERVEWLLRLSAEESLRIYLSLIEWDSAGTRPLHKPSFLLMSMREVLRRLSREAIKRP